ncbi:O-antigen ligase [Marinilactibacillus sp. Marseille-P9653]|uniref:O-antigen ligase family protein n=1 Tax=Marinilactibacillus sp. Marseille-P9653 TaxID=2866583 RepID=UPI001CE3FAF0|nr:O-antigen polymerase [Marinilactibacillus sp. Marseille-P9653]
MKKKELLFAVILFIVETFIDELFIQFLLGLIVVTCFLILNKFKVPNIVFLVPLIMITLIGFINGIIFNYQTFNFFRDSIYFITVIVVITIGLFNIKIMEKNSIDFIKVFIFSVSLNIMYRFFNLLFSNYSNLDLFNLIRDEARGIEITLPITIIILLFYKSFSSNYLISKRVDLILLILNSSFLLLSISRTGIVNLVIGLLVFQIFKLKRNKIKIKLNFGLIILLVVTLVIFFLIPKEIIEILVQKFLNTINEVDSQNNWSSLSDIVSNWRGYEVNVANSLISNGTYYNRIFGFGFGKLIPVQFSNLVGVPVTDGGITILHNGYYHILVKSGIVGLCFYLYFFLKIIFKGLLSKKTFNEVILICISLIYIVSSFVITGLFAVPTKISVLLLIAFLIKKRNNVSERKV